MKQDKKGAIRRIAAMMVMLCLFCSFRAQKVFASDNHVSNIDIEVVIHNDGSATITQHWTGDFQEGTENYIPINTGDIGISGLRVSDEDGSYALVEDWDVDADFEEKVRKCGIVETKKGVELCFGISEYGHKEYWISYLVTDFIKGYQESDGTNFMFINPKMSTFPTAGTVEIRMENGTALNAENAGIWAFGYQGQVVFENGQVVAFTEEDLRGNRAMIVMLELEKGLLSPNTVLNQSFAEVKEEAFENSDYEGGLDKEDKIVLSVLGGIVGIGLLAVVGIVVYSVKRKKAIKEFGDSVGYFTDTPNHGDIAVTHYLARTFDLSSEDNLVIGAMLLSMMNERCLELHTFTDSVSGEEVTVMELLREPEDVFCQRLFHILTAAAEGAGSLQQTAWKDFSYKHYKYITKLIEDILKHGKKTFQQMGGFVKKPGNCIEDLSELGKKELAEVMGLKKYLAENVRMADKDIREAGLWQEYMVYATLFGVADKVIDQLKALYPEQLPMFEDYYYYHYHYCFDYYHCMHESMKEAATQASLEGDGGSSSIGGGGGFSGGGSGGGSR